MPVCQRCTGLYMGIGLTFLWLLLSRNDTKGFPIVYVNIMCLLIMPVFGFHFLDPGPAWRLWSGLIYGNAIVTLFLPAVIIIYNKDRQHRSRKNFSTNSFWILFVFLNSIPFWFPFQSIWLYYATLLSAIAGMLGIVICILLVIVSLIKKFAKYVILKGFYYERPKQL